MWWYNSSPRQRQDCQNITTIKNFWNEFCAFKSLCWTCRLSLARYLMLKTDQLLRFQSHKETDTDLYLTCSNRRTTQTYRTLRSSLPTFMVGKKKNVQAHCTLENISTCQFNVLKNDELLTSPSMVGEEKAHPSPLHHEKYFLLSSNRFEPQKHGTTANRELKRAEVEENVGRPLKALMAHRACV